MRTWVETGRGNFCLRCFVLAAGGTTPDHRSSLAGVDSLPPSFGIGGTVVGRHEWRREAVEADADRRELARIASVGDQHEPRRLE